MKTLLTIVCLMATAPLFAAETTDATADAQRYQLMEVKEGVSTTNIYKIDTETGATWILVKGDTTAFWPLRSYSHQVLDDSKLNKKTEVPDSFIPDKK